jgi:alkylhydroperoxidase family enzyme
MERPPSQPRRETFDESEQVHYDLIVKRFRQWFNAGDAPPEEHFEVGTYFGALLNSPQMCSLASQMGSFFRDVGNTPGSYSHADREFVDQVLSAEFKSNVVQNIHIIDAVKSGVRIEAIEALRYGREDQLNEREQLLAKYIRQVVHGTVDNGTYGRMEDDLGKRGLVEYTGFILWLQWIMRMMQALDTGTLSEEQVDDLIRQAREVATEEGWVGGAGGWHPKNAAKHARN